MKNPAWLALIVLLTFSCRKPPASEQASENPPSPAKREATPVRVNATSAKVAAADKAAVENPRTRPLPRSEDPKYKPAFPIAAAAPGKAGFVFSPFNNRIIDVHGLPPGTLVADPAYPSAEKKLFRIP